MSYPRKIGNTIWQRCSHKKEDGLYVEEKVNAWQGEKKIIIVSSDIEKVVVAKWTVIKRGA